MKALKIISVAAAALCSVALFAACSEGGENGGNNNSGTEATSPLNGNFLYSSNNRYTVTQEETAGAGQIISTVYPQAGQGAPVDYVVDARLQLLRDYSYTYKYSIELRNGGWNDEAVSLVVELKGRYNQPAATGNVNVYEVETLTPTSGTFTVNGADMPTYMGNNSLDQWKPHSSPDLVLDLSLGLDKLSQAGYDIEAYCCAKTFTVDANEGAEGNTLTGDPLFFADILDLIMPYNTYQ